LALPAAARQLSPCAGLLVPPNAVLFIFEETIGTLLGRAAGLGMDLSPHIRSGRIRISHLDPAEVSPGEFVEMVRDSVEKHAVRTVLIDSLNGFLQACPASSSWHSISMSC